MNNKQNRKTRTLREVGIENHGVGCIICSNGAYCATLLRSISSIPVSISTPDSTEVLRVAMAISALRKRRRRKAPLEESGGAYDDEDDGGEEMGRAEADHETAEEVRDRNSGADCTMCSSDESTAEEASKPDDCAYDGKNCGEERATEVIGESVGKKNDNELAGDAHCIGDIDDSTGDAYDGDYDIDSVETLNNLDRNGNEETRDHDTRDDLGFEGEADVVRSIDDCELLECKADTCSGVGNRVGVEGDADAGGGVSDGAQIEDVAHASTGVCDCLVFEGEADVGGDVGLGGHDISARRYGTTRWATWCGCGIMVSPEFVFRQSAWGIVWYGCDTVLSTGPLLRCWRWGHVTAAGAAWCRCGMERAARYGIRNSDRGDLTTMKAVRYGSATMLSAGFVICHSARGGRHVWRHGTGAK